MDLGNYSDDNVPGISGLQLNVPLPKEGDGLRYVEGSAKVLLNADGNKSVSYNSETQQLTMIYVYNGQLLSKEEKNILTFRAEVTGQYDKDTVLEMCIRDRRYTPLRLWRSPTRRKRRKNQKRSFMK